MIIFAMDTSAAAASCALLEDDRPIAQFYTDAHLTHSQTIMPMVESLLSCSHMTIQQVDLFAASVGPGSFTGLRIGVAAVKGMAQVLDKPCIAVSALEGLAYNLCGPDAIVCPIMDARRGQVYTGIYEFCGNELVVLEDQMAISIEELGDHLKKYDKRIIFLGDGVPVFRARLTDEILAEEIKAGRDIQFAPANMNRQRAASVGTLGLRYYAAGKTETAMEHEPDYLRLSQAERERKEREAKSIQ